MLYHHGQLPYEVALAECDQRTRDSFQKLLTQGQQRLPAAIDHLQEIPDDAIVRADRLDLFIRDDNHITLDVAPDSQMSWDVHDNAWTQICTKTGFPMKYAEELRNTDWGRELVALNLNTLFANKEQKRYLVRSVRGQARGFLSDRYRRLDTRPIMDNIFGIAQELGAVCIDATASDVKGDVKFALPTILEPIKNQPMLYWVSARASNFGESKVEISIGNTMAWCTNFAKTDSLFSQVHLGKQLPDDIEFSAETYAKDTAFVVSATRDVFREAFSLKHIEAMLERVKAADSKEAPKDILTALKRAGLTKAEAETATTLYNQPGIEILPPNDSMWRFSNVVSFMAHSAKADRKLELEAIAGNVIPKLHREPVEARLVATA